MAIILAPFIVLAAIGLILSLIAHCFAVLGLPQPLGDAAWGLHIGIFIVWVPTMFVSCWLARDFKSKDSWKAAFRGCPSWMRWMTNAFLIYAIINFVTSFVGASAAQQAPNAPIPPIVFRGFSGHWMVFYSAAFSILYSSVIVSRQDVVRRCPEGHPVSLSADYCEHCGSRITESKFEN